MKQGLVPQCELEGWGVEVRSQDLMTLEVVNDGEFGGCHLATQEVVMSRCL